MDFTHTEDRRMLADTLSRFLRDRYPIATRLKAAASDQGFDQATWDGLAELGILGALFSEDDGGFGGKAFDTAVVFEELGRALVVEPVFASAVLGGGLVAQLGTAAQKAQIEDLIAGTRRLALAHYEPTGRYEASEVTTRATGTKITGRKAVAYNAGTADAIIVSARVSGADDDEAGISLFIVPAGAPGMTVREVPGIDGSRVADITLDGVEGELLGPDGGAWPALEKTLAMGVVALCAESIGAMETAKDLTLDYTKQRKQFGRVIGTFQVLQHRMADMLIELEQAKSALVNAAGRFDGDRLTREKNISAAKNTIGRVGKLIAEESIQIHGGIGMTWEYAVGHFAKRIIMIDHMLGDADYHLARYVDLTRAA
ncbi:MAG: alkylation response protein AidB-like acyl-CoA dehydrogenase [Paracoccaceae bacterium]|jgi:alkylation response protein AidB-like acyl-CoA dehydrogenase